MHYRNDVMFVSLHCVMMYMEYFSALQGLWYGNPWCSDRWIPHKVCLLFQLSLPILYIFCRWLSTYNNKFSIIFLSRLSEAGFPTQLLPTVIRAGETAGCIQSSWYCIPEGTPVGAALGDLQCSILSCSPHSEDAGGLLTVFEFLMNYVWTVVRNYSLAHNILIARFVGLTWGPSGADRAQVGPMLAPWTLLSG